MSKLRYTVGETYYFIRTISKASEPRWGSLYIPGRDTLVGLDIVALKCIEHHNVPGEWDAADAPYTNNGFLFEQLNDFTLGSVAHKGAIWANQYPRASYGQLDDSRDRVVNIYTPPELNTKERAESLSEEELDVCVFGDFKLATELLGNLKRAIDGPVGEDGRVKIRVDLDEAGRAAFENHLNMLIKLVENTSGLKVVFEEWLVEFTEESGKPPYLFKDYWLAKLIASEDALSGAYPVEMDTPLSGV